MVFSGVSGGCFLERVGAGSGGARLGGGCRVRGWAAVVECATRRRLSGAGLGGGCRRLDGGLGCISYVAGRVDSGPRRAKSELGRAS